MTSGEGDLDDVLKEDNTLTSVSLDMEMVRSILSMVSVEALAMKNGEIIETNPTMKRWLVDDLGWTSTKGRGFWEIFPDECSSNAKQWYESIKVRGDRYGMIDLHDADDGREGYQARLCLIACDERDLLLLEKIDNPTLMSQFGEMTRWVSVFRSYISHAGMGLVVLSNEPSKKGIIQYASDEAASILLHDVDELVGKDFVSLVEPEDAKIFRSIMEESCSGRVMSFNESIRIVAPDGDAIILDAWMGPIGNDESGRLYLVFKDDTSRVLLLDELHRFTTVFNKINDSVIVADQDMKILYANPTYLVVTGFNFNELRGKRIQSILRSSGPGSNIEELRLNLEERPHWAGEAWVKTKDSNDFPAEVAVNQSCFSDGTPDINVVTIKDVSRLKDLEMKILGSNEKIEMFIELLVHDLMNFITAIMGDLDIIRQVKMNPSTREALDRANELTERMARLVSQVGVLSQTRIPEPMRAMNLGEVIERALRDTRSIHSDRTIDVEITGLVDDLAVMADDLLHDLFFNILDNAIKYNHHEMPYVGIKIGRKTGTDGRELMISILDNGPGIVDEDKSSTGAGD